MNGLEDFTFDNGRHTAEFFLEGRNSKSVLGELLRDNLETAEREKTPKFGFMKNFNYYRGVGGKKKSLVRKITTAFFLIVFTFL